MFDPQLGRSVILRQIRVEVWAPRLFRRCWSVLLATPRSSWKRWVGFGYGNDMEWWGIQWESNGILRSNLVVSMDSHDERHNWDWKATRVRHAYVGNKTNGYWIWKLRTNNAPGSLLFFKWTKKTAAKDMDQTTFVWRGLSWKAKIVWASDRLKICVAGRQNHDTCGGKVSSGQATLECGWLWRKGGTRIDSDLGCWTSEHMTGVAGLVACFR